jgi:predicted nucleotidyltransferase
MTKLEAAVVEVASFLEERPISYMLIGGLAVSLWGEARATLDADFSLWVEPSNLEGVVADIIARFRPIPSDPLSFVATSKVLPIMTSSGIRADLVFASMASERSVIARAKLKIIQGKNVPVVSVEDLIWMKLISERQKDIEDARRLLRRHASSLDREYLEPIVEQLSEAFARADILRIYRQP